MIKNINFILKLFIIQFFTLSFAINSKVILFSFEGNIVNNLELELETTRLFLEKKGIPIPSNDPKYYRNLSGEEIFERLGLTTETLSDLKETLVNAFDKKINELKPIKGIVELLSKLKQAGHRLGVKIHNKKESVEKFIVINNLSQFFDKELIFSHNNFEMLHHLAFANSTIFNTDTLSITYVGNCIEDCEIALNNFAITKCILIGSDSSWNTVEKLQEWIDQNHDSLSKFDKEYALINSYENFPHNL